MDDGTNILIIVFGVITALIGLVLAVAKIITIRKNKIIIGVIYDRRSGYNDHYFPVIKYKVNDDEQDYTSSHYSIFQKIDRKVRLVFDTNKNRIIGTLSELLFIPLTILGIGIFITSIMIIYELTK